MSAPEGLKRRPFQPPNRKSVCQIRPFSWAWVTCSQWLPSLVLLSGLGSILNIDIKSVIFCFIIEQNLQFSEWRDWWRRNLMLICLTENRLGVLSQEGQWTDFEPAIEASTWNREASSQDGDSVEVLFYYLLADLKQFLSQRLPCLNDMQKQKSRPLLHSF